MGIKFRTLRTWGRSILSAFLVFSLTLTAGRAAGTTFVFIRHGETSWTKAMIPLGIQDLPLTPAGEAQVQDLSKVLQETAFRKAPIYASPLRRTQQTAEILRGPLDTTIVTIQTLEERRFGGGRGRMAHELAASEVPPDAESQESFDIRVTETMLLLMKDNRARPFIVVGHSKFFDSLCHSLGLQSPKIGFAGAYVFQQTGTGWSLEKLHPLAAQPTGETKTLH